MPPMYQLGGIKKENYNLNYQIYLAKGWDRIFEN